MSSSTDISSHYSVGEEKEEVLSNSYRRKESSLLDNLRQVTSSLSKKGGEGVFQNRGETISNSSML